jgi:putative chitinase
MLTLQVMRQMWPDGEDKVPTLVETIAAEARSVFSEHKLDSDLVIAHAMAQFSHECGAGREIFENLNYSAQALMKIWPSRFDAAKAAEFAHNQQRIANEVYGDRMGNRPGTDDGWTYRGRGGSQITGRDAYQKLSGSVGLDLINEPDLVNRPDHFLECAVVDFVLRGCLPFAQHDDVSGVTHHLNGGYIGLNDRIAWLARWKAALSLSNSAEVVRNAAWVQRSLNRLGYEPRLVVDGSFGPITTGSLKSFQRDNRLVADGRLDPWTIDTIERRLCAATSTTAHAA